MTTLTLLFVAVAVAVIMQNKPQFSLSVLHLIVDSANTLSHQQQITLMRIITICFLLFFFFISFSQTKNFIVQFLI